ncbi:MAG TPA: hypothetical protein VJ250_09045 [Nitrososphaeraceae archaeon]|nr:hypothetical protein [Nitrososphaeraceae archaeon]
MFDSSQYYTMEILKSLVYIALGFIPMLALLEVGYRMGMKIRRRKGLVARSVLSPTKSLLPIAFRT